MESRERGGSPVPLDASGWGFPPPLPDGVGDRAFFGGDLAPATLLDGYRSGFFPMPIDYEQSPGEVAWWSPNPRGVLRPDAFHISRTLRRSLRRFELTTNRDFAGVIDGCRLPVRDGAWISAEMRDAYLELHRLGWAHSVEVWNDAGALVGGLYGVGTNGLFAGESMFRRETDASKAALVGLVETLGSSENVLIDVQWLTPHLASLGATEIPRSRYHQLLDEALEISTSFIFELFADGR